MYPDIKRKDSYDNKGIEFVDVNDIRESSNMNQYIAEITMNKERDTAFDKYEKLYLQKRNNIMFIFKFISPFVPRFQMIKANHGITMFILSKKAYIDMNLFIKNILGRKNIYKLPKYFEEFSNSKTYKNILNQCKEDLGLIEATCVGYRLDIQICNKEV